MPPSSEAVLRCAACGRELPLEPAPLECACGGLLELEVRAACPPARVLDARRGERGPWPASGVWRLREVVDPLLRPEEVVSLGEGATPLLQAPAAAAWAGLDALAIKHEGFNPTGSFKDRGMTVAVSRARRAGARLLACASTGNTAASLAAYAAAAGLACAVLAPEGATALGKLSQAQAHGARVLLLRGDFDAAMALLLERARAGALTLVNSVSPFRLQGQKTIALELLADLGWEPPDWIAFPAGNLGNCAAFGLALREARERGWIARLPRLCAVQASGAAPFAAAFARGFDRLVPVRAETLASAIRIGRPVSYQRAVRSIRETAGVVVAVPDAELLAAKAVLDRAGLGCEPASAAGLAGVRRLVAAGTLRPDERVVCVLTGHLLKDPEATLAWHAAPAAEPDERALRNPARILDAAADPLRRALEELAEEAG